jgi:hypothetical protein
MASTALPSGTHLADEITLPVPCTDFNGTSATVPSHGTVAKLQGSGIM